MPDHRALILLVVTSDPAERQALQTLVAASWLRANLHVLAAGVELPAYLARRGRYADPRAAPRPDLLVVDLDAPPAEQAARWEGAWAASAMVPTLVLGSMAPDLWPPPGAKHLAFQVKPLTLAALVTVLAELQVGAG